MKIRVVVCAVIIASTVGCTVAPDENGDLQDLVDRLANGSKKYAPSEAVKAHSKLKEKGISAFSVLLRNLNDKRPACRCFQRQTINRTTVGEVCFDIILMQVERYSYSKEGPFYLTENNIHDWWKQHAGKNLQELQAIALAWTINRIETDESYKHQRVTRLPRLQRALADIEKKGGVH